MTGFVVGIAMFVEVASPDPAVWTVSWLVLLGTSIWWMYLVFGYQPTKPAGLALISIQPLLFMVVIVGMVNDLPERVAWRVSESAMVAAAQTCENVSKTRWIGVFQVDSVRRISNGGCAFRIGQRISTDGLVYFAPGTQPPDRAQQQKSRTYFEPFDGNWFRFVAYGDSD
ncbi:hypothetical protein ACFWU5_10540 [Nocardia sp. NPDC058640]|uniref:hypothetical protein n=1 Tax=Nocardia sp. NPDC058640 TaxID=3346571 RepID=UPI003665A531